MLSMMILDGLGHRESTAKPLDGQFRHRTAAEKIIRDSKKSSREALVTLPVFAATIAIGFNLRLDNSKNPFRSILNTLPC